MTDGRKLPDSEHAQCVCVCHVTDVSETLTTGAVPAKDGRQSQNSQAVSWPGIEPPSVRPPGERADAVVIQVKRINVTVMTKQT